jgi:hypothetical protein
VLTFSILTLALSHALSIAVGAWFYRWMLRRDPAKLERWAQELNDLAAKAKQRFE